MKEKVIVVALKGIIINNGKILIIKRNKSEINGDIWETPGGKIEFGETLEEALLREIKEEVGLDVMVDKMLYATTFMSNPNRQLVILTYLCRSEGDEIKLSNEHTEYKWVAMDEARKYLDKAIVNDFEKHAVFSMLEGEWKCH